ncbi:MAG TPA: CDGSH iron-sulfur domain-containing protein [Nocardioidaceae bacterium]|nr:CDGSH iron-sulfur domain-containing protein [Nocardioidaceae bacterium]
MAVVEQDGPTGKVTRIGEHVVESAGSVVELRPCPAGPVLVRGASAVRDADGQPHPVTRPVVAVCACDKSQRMPWCDGTHKVIPRAVPDQARTSPTNKPAA